MNEAMKETKKKPKWTTTEVKKKKEHTTENRTEKKVNIAKQTRWISLRDDARTLAHSENWRAQINIAFGR